MKKRYDSPRVEKLVFDYSKVVVASNGSSGNNSTSTLTCPKNSTIGICGNKTSTDSGCRQGQE